MKTKEDFSLTEVFSGTPWEAELIKGLLESNEIEAALKDGIMGTLAPYLSPEVSVLVSQDNYEKAIQIINTRSSKVSDD
ncbi:DUF2007-related protein [uncultured Bacteroides sp.]|uniref:DUF2007-related protein n=1 Tax=uncultured Bacteroides sp. TaxID=162156 RepID=UPI002AAAFDE9|nr:DUF2007-related protein [uncultured Bacteroides sp.]